MKKVSTYSHRYVWALLIVALPLCSRAGEVTTLIRDCVVVAGTLERIDMESQTIVVRDSSGVMQNIALTNEMSVFSLQGKMEFMHFHKGAEVVVKCAKARHGTKQVDSTRSSRDLYAKAVFMDDLGTHPNPLEE